jgi:radical SAM protein with 4Fe4S-binding SPASM domain
MRLDVLKDALFNYHVDIVAISLDGATAETNNRIRRGADFNRIVANLRAVVAERNKRGTSLPYMNFVFAAMKSNLLELPALIELAADIGIEEVKAVYLTVFSETLRHESLINEQELVRRIFDEATRKADQLGVKLKLPYIQGEDVGGELPHKPCYVAWRDFFFGSDGFVRPCQSTPMKFFSIDTHAQFVDMWNSKELQEFRSRVNDQITMTEECRRCYQSSHANWNQDHAFLQIANTFAPEWK